MNRLLIAFACAFVSLAAACGGPEPEGPRTYRFALIPKSLDIPVFDYANKGAQRYAA
ncbi:MAG TPA: hypothetical protein VMM93_00720 [Vicinamibacterales bacterium]|nr:hypothetical protein [Vicinamibacterales bacterium]